MTLSTALGRTLGALFVLVAPLLLWAAAVRASLQRDVAALVSPDEAVRAAAQARIAAFGPLGEAALVESLAGPTPVPVMNRLRSRGGPSVIERLIAALDDENEDRRHYAGMTLAYIGADAVPALVETLRSSPVAHVRTSAAWVLSFMGEAGTSALPALEAALSDESKDVRYVARYAIAQLSSGNEAFWTAVEKARAKSKGPPR
jgi:HEAT repeat protein